MTNQEMQDAKRELYQKRYGHAGYWRKPERIVYEYEDDSLLIEVILKKSLELFWDIELALSLQSKEDDLLLIAQEISTF